MRRFLIRRPHGETLMTIAEGIEFSNGRCVTQHCESASAVGVYQWIHHVETHFDGAEVVFLDEETV